MRMWHSTGEDEGSRHAIGNGEMLAYGIGPNLEYVFAPPYSSPPMIGLTVEYGGRELVCESERLAGTAVWRHRIRTRDGLPVAEMTDYLLPDRNILAREIEAAAALSFELAPQPGIRAADVGRVSGGEASSFLFSYTKGPTFLAYDPVTEEVDLLATAAGNAEWEAGGDAPGAGDAPDVARASGVIDASGITGASDASDAPEAIGVPDAPDATGAPGISAAQLRLRLQVRPGTSRLLFAAGARYPDLLRDTAFVLADAEGACLARTLDYWRRFAARRVDFAPLIPAGHPLRRRMLDAIDSVSVLLKCQQSASGGLVPGHRYSPMAYVRDMAGALRGYLALGYREEAEAILRFWQRKWERFGNLENAEGMGDDSVRLSGGNNEVEVPALFILCVFEYVRETGDERLLLDMWPAMEWAFSVQLGHLAGGMLEFSGDETYVAGGVVPRHLIFHGSAEATLLFVTGGAKLLDWAESRGLLKGPKRQLYREKLDEAARLFKANFLPNGALLANQPRRERLAGKPRFQFGFCDAHARLDGQLVNRWIELQEQGYYLCAACKGRAMPDPGIDMSRLYELNSVNLMPVYIASGLFSPEEAAAIAKPGFDRFEAEGAVPSDIGGSRSLGYDGGLMLYNAVKLGHPIKEKLLEKVLGLLDPAGAWAEYYDGDRPADCCRARPWESAMNIEAIAAYIRSLAEHEEGGEPIW